METTFNRSSATLGRLKVSIAEADYKPEVDKKIKEYTKTAQIKGFRPGHVPKEYIQKLYGKSIKVDEVINLVSKTVDNYIKDNKLKVVGDAMPDMEVSGKIDWDNEKEYNFEYDLGMASDFEVKIDALPAVTNYEIQPSEDRVNEAIEDIRKRYGKDTEVEEVEIANDDLIFGTLTQGEYTNDNVVIPSNRIVASAQHIFKGLEKGSSVKFDIQSVFESPRQLGFALNVPEADAAELSGEYEYTVSKITRVTAADIDQDLFDKAVGKDKVSDEAGFREEIKSIIKENYNRESSFMTNFAIEKMLDDSIKIELPDEFLKDWLYKANEGKFTMEQIEKDYDAFARGLRLDLIRNEIAAIGDVKVEYTDVLEEAKNEIRNYFGGYGYDGMEDMIEQMANRTLKEDKDRSKFRDYFAKAFNAKILNYLRGVVKIENKSVSVEEFNQVAEALYGKQEPAEIEA